MSDRIRCVTQFTLERLRPKSLSAYPLRGMRRFGGTHGKRGHPSAACERAASGCRVQGACTVYTPAARPGTRPGRRVSSSTLVQYMMKLFSFLVFRARGRRMYGLMVYAL